jgi:DNA processing protein
MSDPLSWLTLARAPGIEPRVLDTAGGAAALLRESPARLAALGLHESAIRAIRHPDVAALDRDRRWLEGAARGLVTWGSPEYPALLASIPDPPPVLFVEGDPLVLSLPQLAIVGTRNPTTIGRDTATQFAGHLTRAGLVITSGLALGIDAASHRGAIEAGGRSIAVLGSGLDVIYPREHASLAAAVATSGALLSEFPPGTPPLKPHFPQRNRIISGLAVGTLVVEAALHSGSLITARLAGEQGREVFAIPGSIHNTLARGCHRLIRQGAKLVESADDIFQELGALLEGLRQAMRAEPIDTKDVFSPELDKDYEILLDALGFEPTSIDTLVARSGFKADAVASMLLILELEGRVEQQPGGLFCRRLPGKGE